MLRTPRQWWWDRNLPSSQLGILGSYITEKRTHRGKNMSKVQHNLYSVLSTLFFLPRKGQVKCILWWNNLPEPLQFMNDFWFHSNFIQEAWYPLFYFKNKSGIQKIKTKSLKLWQSNILFLIYESTKDKNNAE